MGRLYHWAFDGREYITPQGVCGLDILKYNSLFKNILKTNLNTAVTRGLVLAYTNDFVLSVRYS